jgi:hypothetical protein
MNKDLEVFLVNEYTKQQVGLDEKRPIPELDNQMPIISELLERIIKIPSQTVAQATNENGYKYWLDTATLAVSKHKQNEWLTSHDIQQIYKTLKTFEKYETQTQRMD